MINLLPSPDPITESDTNMLWVLDTAVTDRLIGLFITYWTVSGWEVLRYSSFPLVRGHQRLWDNPDHLGHVVVPEVHKTSTNITILDRERLNRLARDRLNRYNESKIRQHQLGCLFPIILESEKSCWNYTEFYFHIYIRLKY